MKIIFFFLLVVFAGLTGKAQIIAGVDPSLTQSVANSNATPNTIADVTGLSFPVKSGMKYRFRFYIVYTSAATTTGSRWSINGPAFTALHYRSEYTLTSTSRTFNEGLTAYNQPSGVNASSASGMNVAIIEGVIIPSADGSVVARFASEIASSAITVQTMSYVTYKVY